MALFWFVSNFCKPMTLNMTSSCHARGHVNNKGKLNLSRCYTIWVFNQWFHNLYSFLHPAKHGFLFILKNVLFREINDTEKHIKFSKKMIWKNQCLPIFCIWRWNVPYEKKLIQFKDSRNFRFFSNRKSVRLRMRSWSENEREEGRGITFDVNNSLCGDFCLWVGFLVSSLYDDVSHHK